MKMDDLKVEIVSCDGTPIDDHPDLDNMPDRQKEMLFRATDSLMRRLLSNPETAAMIKAETARKKGEEES